MHVHLPVLAVSRIRSLSGNSLNPLVARAIQNILQRWTGYARTGHGGNKLLRARDPENFRFSILQRVSPDLDDASVIAIEGTWKERLNSRSPSGLNDN